MAEKVKERKPTEEVGQGRDAELSEAKGAWGVPQGLNHELIELS